MSQLIMSSAAISDDVDGFNSAISPSMHGQQRQQPDENKKCALGPTAKRSLHKRTKSELQDVIRFFCLDKGCQHARGESYLAMGGLDLGNIICTPCGNSCSICTRRWHEMFLPVYQSSVVLFLEFLMQSGQLPQEITSHPPRLSRLVVTFPLLDDMQRLIGIRCFCWISGSAHSYANNEATTNLMGQEVLQNIS
jgi:hypothetical protein